MSVGGGGGGGVITTQILLFYTLINTCIEDFLCSNHPN